jgi:biopolymer transport protein ExbB
MSSKFDFTLFTQGGLMMWPLLILAIAGILIFIERVLYLHKCQIRTDMFITGIRNLLDKNRYIEALTVCEETPGPVSSVIKAALLAKGKSRDEVVGAIQGVAVVQIPSLQRRIAWMSAIARVGPILGLLGTVIGMIDAFYGIHSGGAYANMGTISGGFAAALVATAFGLAIAAMAHLAHHFLNSRVESIVNDMEYAGQDILQTLLAANAHASQSVAKAAEASPVVVVQQPRPASPQKTTGGAKANG